LKAILNKRGYQTSHHIEKKQERAPDKIFYTKKMTRANAEDLEYELINKHKDTYERCLNSIGAAETADNAYYYTIVYVRLWHD
jgi:hypothetical protein